MIEHHIKAATCRISCGAESGTGWLVTKDRVITARHCVLDGIEASQPVELFFQDFGDTAVSATIVAHSEDWDTCLLSFEAKPNLEPLPVSMDLPREGEIWQTFGYPQSKIGLGHRLTGEVAQVLETPKLKIDLDLSIDPTVALQAYRGVSGAAVVCEGAAVGMVRLKVDGTVAALSLHQLEGFLTENGVAVPTGEATVAGAPLLADRGDFFQGFAEAVQARAGRYLFLEGAHGYGKSTFCKSFQIDDQKLINLGAYCLSDPNSALGADYRAQPQVFFDWFATTVSALITGQPPRKVERSYAEQIRDTALYLNELSKYCAQSGRQGMFFIDGLNEIPTEHLRVELLGLLPAKLPQHVTIVLTAPNFDNLAGTLAGKVKANDIFQLPPLPDSACYRYCQWALKSERRSADLIAEYAKRLRDIHST